MIQVNRLICSPGHVQIAQVPGRNEPDSAGELDYRYLFSLLETMGYCGYIGCEYKPLGETPAWFRPPPGSDGLVCLCA